MRNLLVFFNNISALEPNRIAISIKERDITYLQLNRLVLAYAISLHNHGVTNKSCVALGIKSDFPSLLSIMATAYIGASWVQLTGSTVKNYKQLNVSHVLLEGALKSPFNDVIPIKLDKSWFKVESPIDVNLLSLLDGNQSDDDVWMYAQSSGSTGTQKFMALISTELNKMKKYTIPILEKSEWLSNKLILLKNYYQMSMLIIEYMSVKVKQKFKFKIGQK